MSLYERQVKTETPTKIELGKDSKLIYQAARGFEKKSEEYKQQADSNYQSLLSMQGQDAINELARNPEYANNPVGLKQKIGETLDGMASQIPDKNMQIKFLVGRQSEANSLVNTAYKNALTQEKKRSKGVAYDSIYKGSESAGNSFANIVGGDYDENDVQNFFLQNEKVNSSIYSKDSYGNDYFTPEQQRKYRQDYNKSLVNNFEFMYMGLDEGDRNELFKKLEKGTISMGTLKGADGVEKEILLKDRIPKEVYMDMVKKARTFNKEYTTQKNRELKLMREQALTEYMRNPTKTNRNTLREVDPTIKPEKLDEIEAVVEELPNYECETEPEAKIRIESKFNEIMEKDYRTETDGGYREDTSAMIDDIMDFTAYVRAQNNAGLYSKEDADEMIADITEMMMNSEYRNALANIQPDKRMFVNTFMAGSENDSLGRSISFIETKDDKEKEFTQKHLYNLYDYTNRQAMNALRAGDEEAARRIYKKGSRNALNFIYPEAKDKEVGETFVRNGVAYQIVGFGSDLIVKVAK